MSTEYIVIVADDEQANLLFVSRVLAAAGWRVVAVAGGDAAVAAAAREPPHLVILDINMPGTDGWAAATAIRAGNGAAAAAPILAYTSFAIDDAELAARGMDGRIPKPCTPATLVAAVARWRPGGELAGVARLQSAFGAAEIDRLVRRFGGQLADALATLDATDARGVAHRIAGVAGTLGFAAVSASWLAVSEGQEAMLDEARRHARIAIAAIERGAWQDGSS